MSKNSPQQIMLLLTDEDAEFLLATLEANINYAAALCITDTVDQDTQVKLAEQARKFQDLHSQLIKAQTEAV